MSIADIVVPVATALASGGLGSIGTWLAVRRRGDASDRRVEGQERVAELEHDGTVARPLLDRIDTLEGRADRCDRQNRLLRRRHRRERVADKEACDRSTKVAVAAARNEALADIQRVAREVTEILLERAEERGDEPTGVTRLMPVLTKRPSSAGMMAVPEIPTDPEPAK